MGQEEARKMTEISVQTEELLNLNIVPSDLKQSSEHLMQEQSPIASKQIDDPRSLGDPLTFANRIKEMEFEPVITSGSKYKVVNSISETLLAGQDTSQSEIKHQASPILVN